jgi:hypothetical protein
MINLGLLNERWIRTLFSGLLAVILVPGIAGASLQLRQPSLKLMLDKGQVFYGGIVLENVSGKDLTVKAEAVPALESDGKPSVRSCSDWMLLEDGSFILPAGGIKDLRFKISVPQKAEGGYYSSIVYSYHAGQMQGPDDMTFNIKMHIEMPVNIQISGTVKNDISIKDLGVSYNDNRMVEIASTVVNTGNSFTDVKASYLILSPDGSVVQVFSSGNIKLYPGDERQIPYIGQAKLEKGENTMIGIFDFGGESPMSAQKKLLVK